MARKHNEDEVLKSLNKKNDVKVSSRTKKILVLTDKVFDKTSGKMVANSKKSFDLGNGSWGRIDFLHNYHGYTLLRVGSFPKNF
jgi:hypothetical protein